VVSAALNKCAALLLRPLREEPESPRLPFREMGGAVRLRDRPRFRICGLLRTSQKEPVRRHAPADRCVSSVVVVVVLLSCVPQAATAITRSDSRPGRTFGRYTASTRFDSRPGSTSGRPWLGSSNSCSCGVADRDPSHASQTTPLSRNGRRGDFGSSRRGHKRSAVHLSKARANPVSSRESGSSQPWTTVASTRPRREVPEAPRRSTSNRPHSSNGVHRRLSVGRLLPIPARTCGSR
jgi:hypothetical protein